MLQLAGARLDLIRRQKMEQIGLEDIPAELEQVEVPPLQKFPQWMQSELNGQGLPNLSAPKLQERIKAGRYFFGRRPKPKY